MAASLEEKAIEFGGTIGITVLGSVLAGVYATLLILSNGAVLPPAVHEGVDQALVARHCRPTWRTYWPDPCTRRLI
jgi:MFS transporter, DHA2 family, multidrug resistance protein